MGESEQDKDPVVHSSLSTPLYITSALLVLSLGWALWDEIYGTRPWKSYQKRFQAAYTRFIRTAKPTETASEQQIRASADYRRMEQQLEASRKQVEPKLREIDEDINQKLTPQILALNEAFQILRSEIGALTYEIEVSHSDAKKNSLRQDIGEIKKRVVRVNIPEPDGSNKRVDYTYDRMEKDLSDWKLQKAKRIQERVA